MYTYVCLLFAHYTLSLISKFLFCCCCSRFDKKRNYYKNRSILFLFGKYLISPHRRHPKSLSYRLVDHRELSSIVGQLLIDFHYFHFCHVCRPFWFYFFSVRHILWIRQPWSKLFFSPIQRKKTLQMIFILVRIKKMLVLATHDTQNCAFDALLWYLFDKKCRTQAHIPFHMGTHWWTYVMEFIGKMMCWNYLSFRYWWKNYENWKLYYFDFFLFMATVTHKWN